MNKTIEIRRNPGGQLGLALLTGIGGEQRGDEGVEPKIGVRSDTIRMFSSQGFFCKEVSSKSCRTCNVKMNIRCGDLNGHIWRFIINIPFRDLPSAAVSVLKGWTSKT